MKYWSVLTFSEYADAGLYILLKNRKIFPAKCGEYGLFYYGAVCADNYVIECVFIPIADFGY